MFDLLSYEPGCTPIVRRMGKVSFNSGLDIHIWSLCVYIHMQSNVDVYLPYTVDTSVYSIPLHVCVVAGRIFSECWIIWNYYHHLRNV